LLRYVRQLMRQKALPVRTRRCVLALPKHNVLAYRKCAGTHGTGGNRGEWPNMKPDPAEVGSESWRATARVKRTVSDRIRGTL
jgi:hypothetical protein